MTLSSAALAERDALSPAGLSSEEAARRLAEFGRNAVAEGRPNPLLRLLHGFWQPVPWMLEVAIIVQITTQAYIEALMIAALLIFNVLLGVVQEGRADAALALLKQHLSLKARIKRDGRWIDAPADIVVPGDVLQLSLGSIVPADTRVLQGTVLLDQSMLTGESLPAEVGPGETAYGGALVRRGEATVETIATGTHTFSGRAAELVRVAHAHSSEERAVLGVVRNLSAINAGIVIALIGYAYFIAMPIGQLIPLVLTAILSAVPIALPATFTLAAALGARALALKGVLLTRLSALHEAATVDVLCADKTGTLTQNDLTVALVRPLGAEHDDADILALAALASSAAGQDLVDQAICTAAAAKGPKRAPGSVKRFTPFDPATKMAEALVTRADGHEFRVVKGAPSAVAAIAPMAASTAAELETLLQGGYRMLAVAADVTGTMAFVGLIALSDPPRADSRALLSELNSMGVRTVMVSGDSVATAATVARSIGLDGRVCEAGEIPERIGPEDFAVHAGVFPEDKSRLVKAFQARGHTVGMCGDGANDAPALRQAQMGIAVSTATDVAKSAASIVLTEPGLGGIVTCIKEGRSAFQRILTYTLSMLDNKSATLIVLGVGLVMTRDAILTPSLVVLSMLLKDFTSMALVADRVTPSRKPNAWHIGSVTIAALILAVLKLAFLTGILALAWYDLRLTPDQMQTLTFVALVFWGQAALYVLRERQRMWHSRPGFWLVFFTLMDVAITTGLAAMGVLMTPLRLSLVITLLAATAAFALALDFVKVAVFRLLQIE